MEESNKKSGKRPEKSLLYRTVTTELRRRIVEGIYQPNEKLPGLNELTDEFGVSVITVRRALRELSYEGLIYGHQGLGVFVREKSVIHRVFAGHAEWSIGSEIARAGYTPRIEELDFEPVGASEETARRLGVKIGTKLLRHRKVAYADEDAISLHTLHFPMPLGRRLRQRLARDFIFRVLKDAKIEISHFRFEFSAAALDNEQSTLFGLSPGFPMSLVYFTPLDADGRPIMTGLTICRSDRFIYQVEVPASIANAVETPARVERA